MDRTQRRRVRRLKRRIRRGARTLAPILLLVAAAALSMGVVRVVERGPGLGLDDDVLRDRFAEPVPLQSVEVEEDVALKIDSSPDFHSSDPSELIRAAMPASVLEVDWSVPEQELDELPPVEAPGPWLLDFDPELAPSATSEPADHFSAVPEPRTSLLFAGGLAWLAARRIG